MPKFHGVIGFGDSVEQPAGSGIWIDAVTARSYFGDVIRGVRNLNERQQLNDDVSLSYSVSVMADEYAIENYQAIRYVEESGTFWTVDAVELKLPRLLLTLGDVYQGEVAEEEP